MSCESKDQVWWVYLLECSSGRIYTGVSPNLEERIKKHYFGKGALFTKINKPEKLLASKAFKSKSEALSVEKQIKQMPAKGKRSLALVWNREQKN